MHPDQKIGLSLAILLIGFAGAFCFRLEPASGPETAVLAGADELDMRIEHLPIRAYTEREGALPPANHPAEPIIDAPFADLIAIGSPALAASAPLQPREGLHMPLFAGPPEPLRITPDRLPGAGGRRTSTADAPAPSNRGDFVDAAGSARQPSLIDRTSPATPSEMDALHKEQRATFIYEVRAGDTLSELAQQFLGSSRRYQELYELNQDVLASPDSLRPGTPLRIPEAR